MNRLADHIAAHPVRAFATSVVSVLMALVLAGSALMISLDDSRAANVENCRALNELRRDLYVTAADLGVSPALRDRFLPSENCEDLP